MTSIWHYAKWCTAQWKCALPASRRCSPGGAHLQLHIIKNILTFCIESYSQGGQMQNILKQSKCYIQPITLGVTFCIESYSQGGKMQNILALRAEHCEGVHGAGVAPHTLSIEIFVQLRWRRRSMARARPCRPVALHIQTSYDPLPTSRPRPCRLSTSRHPTAQTLHSRWSHHGARSTRGGPRLWLHMCDDDVAAL